jgi:hypothetical protein
MTKAEALGLSFYLTFPLATKIFAPIQTNAHILVTDFFLLTCCTTLQSTTYNRNVMEKIPWNEECGNRYYPFHFEFNIYKKIPRNIK